MVTPFQIIGRFKSEAVPIVTLSPMTQPCSMATPGPMRQLSPISAGGSMLAVGSM